MVFKRGERRLFLLFLCFLVIFIINLEIIFSDCPCGSWDSVTLEPCPCPGGGGEGTGGGRYREYVTMIEQTLAEGKVVDFSKDPYKSNPEVTLEALKEKYPNLALSSIKGVKIDGNTLTTADGSKIDLTTGKPITVETDGNRVTYFDDGSGTTIVNGKGVEYTTDTLEVESADSVDYYGSKSTGVQNYEATPDTLKIGSADSVEYYGSTSTIVQNYEAKIGTFTVASADAVIIGSNIFNKVKDSVFSVIANILVYADVNSAKNNNTAIIENPIEGSSEDIKVD